MVMDAKAKAGNFSFNDLLLKGPDLVPALTSLLWRGLFRGMGRTNDPDIYVMEAMIFGAVSSPSVAQFVKNENAKNLESECPGITKAIHLQLYVDDYFDCFDTEEEAVRMVQNVIQAHKQGGFELVKWISNSPKVMQSIPSNILLHEHDTSKSLEFLD